MVNIQNAVTEDEIIDALNIMPPDPASYIRFLERYSKGVSPDVSPTVEAQVSEVNWEWLERVRRELYVGRPNVQSAFVLNYLARAP
jgi:hypothetical protein